MIKEEENQKKMEINCPSCGKNLFEVGIYEVVICQTYQVPIYFTKYANHGIMEGLNTKKTYAQCQNCNIKIDISPYFIIGYYEGRNEKPELKILEE